MNRRENGEIFLGQDTRLNYSRRPVVVLYNRLYFNKFSEVLNDSI